MRLTANEFGDTVAVSEEIPANDNKKPGENLGWYGRIVQTRADTQTKWAMSRMGAVLGKPSGE